MDIIQTIEDGENELRLLYIELVNSFKQQTKLVQNKMKSKLLKNNYSSYAKVIDDWTKQNPARIELLNVLIPYILKTTKPITGTDTTAGGGGRLVLTPLSLKQEDYIKLIADLKIVLEKEDTLNKNDNNVVRVQELETLRAEIAQKPEQTIKKLNEELALAEVITNDPIITYKLNEINECSVGDLFDLRARTKILEHRVEVGSFISKKPNNLTSIYDELSFEELSSIMTSPNFSKLSDKELMQVCQAVSASYLKKEGVPPCLVRFENIKDKPNQFTKGFYSPADEEIVLNNKLITMKNEFKANGVDSSYIGATLLSTIIHESRHRVQFNNLDKSEKTGNFDYVTAMLQFANNANITKFSDYLGAVEELDARNATLCELQSLALGSHGNETLKAFYEIEQTEEIHKKKTFETTDIVKAIKKDNTNHTYDNILSAIGAEKNNYNVSNLENINTSMFDHLFTTVPLTIKASSTSKTALQNAQQKYIEFAINGYLLENSPALTKTLSPYQHN
ncbi:MAG: hypothetical protein RR334_00495 [Clostridia bacterium]